MKVLGFILILLAVLLMATSLVSCNTQEENQKAREICEATLKAVMNNDKALMASTVGVGEADVDDAIFNKYRDIVKDTKTYELKQVGWYYSKENSESETTSVFQATTDNQKIIGVTVVQKSDGRIGVSIGDDTEFVEDTKYVSVGVVVLLLLSLASIAFIIWMIVDASKRKLKKKAWWIILILVSVWVEILLGVQDFDTSFGFGIFFNASKISTNTAYRYVLMRIYVPVGALIYFFLRKKLPLKPDANEAEPIAETTEESEAQTESAENAYTEPTDESSDDTNTNE